MYAVSFFLFDEAHVLLIYTILHLACPLTVELDINRSFTPTFISRAHTHPFRAFFIPVSHATS